MGVAKLLKDSGKGKGLAIMSFAQEKGSEAVATVYEGVRKYTGKANYQFGDLTKATWDKLTGNIQKTEEQSEQAAVGRVATQTASGGYSVVLTEAAEEHAAKA